MKRCNKCNMIMSDNSTVCFSCKGELEGNYTYICNRCGKVNAKNTDVCPECGAENLAKVYNSSTNYDNSTEKVSSSVAGIKDRLKDIPVEAYKKDVASFLDQAKDKLKDVPVESYKESAVAFVGKAKDKLKDIPVDSYKEEAASLVDKAKDKLKDIPVDSYKENASAFTDKIKQKVENITAGDSNNSNGTTAETSATADEAKTEQSGQPSLLSSLFNIKSLGIFVVMLIVGFGGGYAWGYKSVESVDLEPFKLEEITKDVVYSKAHVGKNVCVLLTDSEVYDSPSVLQGKIIAKMQSGAKVLDGGVVDSLDSDNIGIISRNLTIERLFSHSYYVPKGTEALIVGLDKYSGEILCKVKIEGKVKNITVTEEEIKLPYSGTWRKIILDDKREGYVFNMFASNPTIE